MRIDADTHISCLGEANNITAEELISMLDAAGLDKAITWLQPPYVRSELPRLIDYIHESYMKYPDRIIPFGWADPHLGMSESKDIIRRCLSEYGFKGVKLNGAQNEYYIDDEKISIPLIEEIAKYNGIVAFHSGADVCDYTHPYRIAKIARRFPELRIFLIHMGGASFTAFSDAAIEVAAECSNITLIGSAIRSKPLIKAIRMLGPERIAYGSDAPFEIPYIEVARYEAFLSREFPEGYKDLIMGNTIKNVLGLE